MRWVAVLAALVLSLAAAWAQEPAKGWLGIELKDMTKEEADALGKRCQARCRRTSGKGGASARRHPAFR